MVSYCLYSGFYVLFQSFDIFKCCFDSTCVLFYSRMQFPALLKCEEVLKKLSSEFQKVREHVLVYSL